MLFFMSVKFLFYVSYLLSCIVLYFSLQQVKKSSETIINNEIESINTGDQNNVGKLYMKKKSTIELKYILRWTSSNNYFSTHIGVGQQGFVIRNCTYTNCFITSNSSYLGGLQKFDAVAFAGDEVTRYTKHNLPKTRSSHQKYVFATKEPSDYYPVCSDYLNNFFNWTYTYKTNSDAKWGYLAIRDSDGILIGPNSIMHWRKIKDMKPVGYELKEKLKSKRIAAAWFVSRCYSKSKREILVKEIQKELSKYSLNVDIYGKCGPLKCSKKDKCLKMLEKNYYFYLSFENSFCEDYVTEKLLHPLQYNTVPIVYGGANYTRFMPDGIYLNARELSARRLAEKMHELILNPEKYAEYFKWKNHYSYHSNSNAFCNICSMLNNKKLMGKVSTYVHMKKWWNPPNRC